MAINFSKPAVQWTTLICLAFIWGSSFILMKRGLVAFSAIEIAAYRIFAVSVCMLPFSFQELSLFKGKKAFPLLVIGFLGSAIPYFLFVKSITHISSSLSGILNSMTPLFTMLLALLFFKQRFLPKSIIGIALGFLGACGLIYFSGGEASIDSFNIWVLMPIIAAASYGLNVNVVKMYLQDVKPITVTALSFIVVGPISGIYLFTSTDFVAHATTHPAGLESLLYITLLAVVGTALAVYAFNMLIKETSALFASSVTYMIPVFAILWGVLDGEHFSWPQAVFAGVILIGISLINSKRRFSK